MHGGQGLREIEPMAAGKAIKSREKVLKIGGEKSSRTEMSWAHRGKKQGEKICEGVTRRLVTIKKWGTTKPYGLSWAQGGRRPWDNFTATQPGRL